MTTKRNPSKSALESQGEGDVEAARRYNDKQHQFVQAGKAEAPAQAEKLGQSRAEGEDPFVPGANAAARPPVTRR